MPIYLRLQKKVNNFTVGKVVSSGKDRECVRIDFTKQI